MAVQFEDQLGEALRAYPGAFTYHPPDAGRQFAGLRPGDFITCFNGRFYLVEAKQCRTGTFSLALWTPQQRNFCKVITEAGGIYVLAVNWRGPSGTPTHKTTARLFEGVWLLGRLEKTPELKSLRPDDPSSEQLTWIPGRGWDVRRVFGIL